MGKFDNYKFRASMIGALMTQPRAKTAVLSETTMTLLDEIWIREMFGREKQIESKYMSKGSAVEQDALQLVSDVDRLFYAKNDKQYENEYFTGTPDVILFDKCLDTKASWDIFTFHAAELTRPNYWQGLIYAELTGVDKTEICYCLVDTTADIVDREINYLQYKGLSVEEHTKRVEMIEKNSKFEDIEKTKRVKRFVVDYSKDEINTAINAVALWRDYLNGKEKL